MGNQCLGNRDDYEYSLHCIPSSRKPFLGYCRIEKKPLSVELPEEVRERLFPTTSSK